jgi:hypothetical protein
MLFRSSAVLLAAVFALQAPAADLVGYADDPARYDRFASGFPASPVATAAAQFLGAGLDLSGVGWVTAGPRTGVTLIADRYIIGSAHNGFAVGTGVTFAGTGGLRAFTVDQVTRLSTGALPSDLIVGRLSASTAGTGVTPIPVGQVSAAQVVGTPLLVYGSNPNAPYSNSPHLGLGTVAGTRQISAFGGADDNVVYEFLRDPAVAGSAQAVGGDSGSPSLVRQGNQAVILGTHYAIGTLGGQPATFDVFLSEYLLQIRQATDFTVLVAPVPEPAGLLIAAVAAAACGRVRRQTATAARA